MAQLKAGSTIGGKVIASLAALYDHSLDETGDVHGAVSANTASMIVRRDSSGDFAAGEIIASSIGIGLTPTANMLGLSIEDGLITLKERSTPTADTNYGKIYTKTDNNLYFQDGAGNEKILTTNDLLAYKVIEIGAWDVSAATASSKTVYHSTSNIRAVSVSMQEDGGSYWHVFSLGGSAGNPTGWIDYITTSQIVLQVPANSQYNSGGGTWTGTGNRGWITIWYEP